MMRHTCLLAAALLLIACDDAAGPDETEKIVPDETDIAFAQSAQPADDSIAGIYNRTCRNCHVVSGVGAPLTGHAEAWAPRLAERGRQGLLQSTKLGYRFMPARGLCTDCSDEDYLALIDFMMTPADAPARPITADDGTAER